MKHTDIEQSESKYFQINSEIFFLDNLTSKVYNYTLQFQIIVLPLINFWIFCRTPLPFLFWNPRFLVFQILFCRYFRDC